MSEEPAEYTVSGRNRGQKITVPVELYPGQPEELERIARELGYPNLSRMLQALADSEIQITKR